MTTSAAASTVSPRTVFISGPIEPGEDYFLQHYVPLIRDAISAGDSFVMGPAPGMDTMALQYLLKENVHPSRITVYFSEFQVNAMRNLKEWFERGLGGNIKVEGVTTADRDGCMTRDSDYDILRYMSVEEQKIFYGERYFPRVSATEKNERRRLGLPLHTNLALEAHLAEIALANSVDSSSRPEGRPKSFKLLNRLKQALMREKPKA